MKRLHLFIYISAACLAMAFSSCSTSKKATVTMRPTTSETAEHRRFVSHLPRERRMIVEEAKSWLGTPYQYAAQEKGSGTDCSGLVMQVYLSALDCAIPRNSAKQAEYCIRIKEADAEAGDLVFFATGKDSDKVSHVGIIVEDGGFIHASSSKGVVISKLSNPWYAKRILMFGRVPALDRRRAER